MLTGLSLFKNDALDLYQPRNSYPGFATALIVTVLFVTGYLPAPDTLPYTELGYVERDTVYLGLVSGCVVVVVVGAVVVVEASMLETISFFVVV